jgi:NAD(P)-dependent dehydrogenase (short-subunit alcohol dehydrogenase family)
MKKLAIVGNSTLGKAFIEKYKNEFEITTFCRPDYDISNKESCIRLIEKLNEFEIVAITSGLISEDLWETFAVNTIGPSFVAHELYTANKVKRVVVVSSYAGTWSSWPHIEKWRLIYNASKQATTNFLQSLYHSSKSNTKVTAFDPSGFKSRMNPNEGMEIEQVVDTLHYICTLPDELNLPNIKLTN